jgi:hypothetical protein
LEELDLKKLSPTQMDTIKDLLKQETPEILKYNLRMASIKVSDFLVKNILSTSL